MSLFAAVSIIALVSLPAQRAQAQGTGIITGRVNESVTGTTLRCASVTVVGTQLTALTADNGRYTILDVPPGTHQVQAKLLGFDDRTVDDVIVQENAPVVLDIKLSTDVIQLDEIVAVGYGSDRRQDIAGAVTSLRLRSITGTSALGADHALKALIAGVQVSAPNGAPGGGAYLRVRGVSAGGAGGQPLYVIDGLQISGSDDDDPHAFLTRSPLNDIPLSDIESITVLKDAASTAIYGTRGSNGVVIITTKRAAPSARRSPSERATSERATATGSIDQRNPTC